MNGSSLHAEIETAPAREELFELARALPRATFFHTPAWMEALGASMPGFAARWIAVREGGRMRGALPFIIVARGPLRSLQSLPFGTYGGAVTAEKPVRRALLDRFASLARSPRTVEAAVSLYLDEPEEPMPPGFASADEECRVIRLEGDADEWWRERVSAKRRQLARRAEEAGVTVRPLGSEGEVEAFHALYRRESAAWGGVHPYPRRLFLELFRRRDDGTLFLGAFLGGKLLGGHIDLFFGKTAQAWQGGLAAEAKEHEAGALLIRYAVAEAFARGMNLFNLGSSGGNAGILFFKESLGGEERRYRVATMRKRWWALARGR